MSNEKDYNDMPELVDEGRVGKRSSCVGELLSAQNDLINSQIDLARCENDLLISGQAPSYNVGTIFGTRPSAIEPTPAGYSLPPSYTPDGWPLDNDGLLPSYDDMPGLTSEREPTRSPTANPSPSPTGEPTGSSTYVETFSPTPESIAASTNNPTLGSTASQQSTQSSTGGSTTSWAESISTTGIPTYGPTPVPLASSGNTIEPVGASQDDGIQAATIAGLTTGIFAVGVLACGLRKMFSNKSPEAKSEEGGHRREGRQNRHRETEMGRRDASVTHERGARH